MISPRKVFTFSRICRLGAIVAIAAATACSSSGSPAAPNGPSGTTPALGARMDAASCPASVVYVVAATQGSSIQIYDRAHLRGGPCGSITGLASPQGLFVDGHSNLWVTDANQKNVYEFVPGGKTPAMTLNDPNGVPAGVVVDEKSGTVYVVDYQNFLYPTQLAEVYAKGSTTPTGALSDPNARNGGSDAIDNQGNVYVTFMTQSNAAQVDEWLGGKGNSKNLGLKLISAGAIVTTSTGTLAVCDPFAFRCGEFAPGSTKMSHVFGHMGRGRSNDVIPDKLPLLHPDGLALDRSERQAFVSAKSLTQWNFPGPNGRPNHLPVVEVKVPGGAYAGVAVSPASRPGAPY
jgi:hypothetical protein